jgi:hypothetical protein
MKYPSTPGYKVGGTSKAAAKAIAPKAKTLRERMLEVWQTMDATPDEVCDVLQITPFSGRPRATELYKLGLIVIVGYRVNESGREANLYRAKK